MLPVLSIIGFARFTAKEKAAIRADAPAADPLLREIVDYRKWTRVNERPLLVVDPALVGG
jgi:hypothetical protein